MWNQDNISNDSLLDAIYETATQPAQWAQLFVQLAGLLIQGTLNVTLLEPPEGTAPTPSGTADPMARACFHSAYKETETTETASFAQWPRHTGYPPDTIQRLLRQQVGTGGLGRLGMPGRVGASSYSLPIQLYPLAATGTLFSQPHKLSVCTLVLTRPRGSDPEGAASPLLKALYPHLERAHRIGQTLSRLHAVETSQAAALDTISHACFGLTPTGQILWANTEAETLLETQGMFRLASGYLQAVWPEEQRALREALTQLKNPDQPPQSGVLLFRGQGDVIRVGRLLAGTEGHQRVLLLKDPQAHHGACATELQKLYHLTLAETRVALLLADGLSPEQIAGQVHATVNTVRNQLKNVYQRTGTCRQGEVIRLVLNLS